MKARSAMAAALVWVLLLLLTACGGALEQQAAAYIQWELDCTYKGRYPQEYLDQVEGMTQESARQQYEDNAQAEAQRLLEYLEVYAPDAQINQRAAQLVKDIYASARYTVGGGSLLSDGSFAVEVTLSPIELFHLLPRDICGQVWDQVCRDNGVDPERANALSQEAWQALDREYAAGMLDRVEALLPQLTYGQDQTVTLRLTRDGSFVSLDAGSWQALDDMVIDYTGAYR